MKDDQDHHRQHQKITIEMMFTPETAEDHVSLISWHDNHKSPWVLVILSLFPPLNFPLDVQSPFD